MIPIYFVKESVNLKESVKNEEPVPMDHLQTSNVILGTDSSEQNLSKAAMKEHTIIHEHIIFWNKMVSLNTERRAIITWPIPLAYLFQILALILRARFGI